MSAFTVSDTHISAIVAWACRHNVKVYHGNLVVYEPGMEQEAADCLLAENIKSVNYCYPNDVEKIVPCEYDPKVKFTKPVEVIKLCHSLEYQSCEHPEWEASAAKEILRVIEAEAVSALPGYDAAPWTI